MPADGSPGDILPAVLLLETLLNGCHVLHVQINVEKKNQYFILLRILFFLYLHNCLYNSHEHVLCISEYFFANRPHLSNNVSSSWMCFLSSDLFSKMYRLKPKVWRTFGYKSPTHLETLSLVKVMRHESYDCY